MKFGLAAVAPTSVLGCADALPVFLAALAGVAGTSGVFIWLNRDVAVEAATAAVAWSMAAFVLLGLTASSGDCLRYLTFAIGLVALLASLAGAITFYRHRPVPGEGTDETLDDH